MTTLFWYWSGMASLGLAYLLFIALVVMLVLAWHLYPQRKLSRFHRAAFVASASYVGVLACCLAARIAWRKLAGGV